jgi:hypothetical protein
MRKKKKAFHGSSPGKTATTEAQRHREDHIFIPADRKRFFSVPLCLCGEKHLIHPGLSSRQNCVIPAKAGIQWIKNPPRKRNNIMVLSASRGVFSCWIPAFAGMTG